MAAVLIPAISPRQPHELQLPDPGGAGRALEEVRYGLGSMALRGPVRLEAGAWLLTLPELRELQTLLDGAGLSLQHMSSSRPETLVAAAALGLIGEPSPSDAGPAAPLALPPVETNPSSQEQTSLTPLTIHRGTLRSGDHLQCANSVLLLGDVNPGARISADGHVLVWGRLRGVAHAGRRGYQDAKIVALQLRPLQLRIAAAVARGPEELPPAGQAEEARLVDGAIRIDPATPSWPLAD